MFDLVTSTPDDRAHLLSGPTVALSLASSHEGLPVYTIPNLPRRMLFALSTVAAHQLSHQTTTAAYHPSGRFDHTTNRTVHLPAGSANPAALEYALQWMKQVCRRRELTLYPYPNNANANADYALIPRRDSFRHAILTYQAAIALGATHVERAYARYLCDDIAVADAAQLPGEREVRMAVVALGDANVVVRALRRRVAGARAEVRTVGARGVRYVPQVDGTVEEMVEEEVEEPVEVREMRELVDMFGELVLE
ncbi:hypothetical protein K490DRAFT_68654 [Saccharata proteae CBS 121410]|uniref:Uncharacterized protein n=1 Tax=Saccharata proteae CBS 121410 TaxID=1314787 RepID=A0A9P4HMU5_9PEZI|nr:hypothetical protein K490DRAFT_68654 [Saccharata proteae CBS 121410]